MKVNQEINDGKTMDQISLCLIVKDEERFLPEWIDYHILIGVDRFYIYDNESQIDLSQVLADYINRGWVVLQKFPGKAVQLKAYKHCLDLFGKKTHWMGFVDADEFIVPKNGKNLKVFLADYESFAGLAINSVFFGKNGHLKRPEGGQILNYLYRTEDYFPDNKLVKCFVQPEHILFPDSPHGFTYKKNKFCVNENQQRVDYQRFPFSNKKIQINHYFCRSEEDIQEKMARKLGGAGRAYDYSRFEKVDKGSCIEDLEIFSTINEQLTAAGVIPELQINKKNLAGIYQTFRRHMKQKKTAGIPYADQNDWQGDTSFEEYLKLKENLKSASAEKNILKARELTLQLINLFPGDVIHYTSFATLSLQIGDFDSAWKALSQAWQIHKEAYEVLRVMADYFYLIKNYSMAENAFLSLLEIGPEEVSVRTRLGLVLINLGRFDEAYEQLLKVLENRFFKDEVNEDMVQDLLNLLIIHYRNSGENLLTRQLSGFLDQTFNIS